MNLLHYIENHEGVGILSTASSGGKVNAAVYARPHVLEPDVIAFIMRERRSRQNLHENRSAHYLFVEKGGKANGIRLQLEMIEEIEDSELIRSISRRKRADNDDEPKHFVTFKVLKALQLIGGQEVALQ